MRLHRTTIVGRCGRDLGHGRSGRVSFDFIAVAGAPVITLDLGADRALSEISAWGYSDTNANGVSQFSLRFASQADGPGGFGSTISYNPSFPLANSQLIRQSNLFNQVVTARYVEFTASDNFFVAQEMEVGARPPAVTG